MRLKFLADVVAGQSPPSEDVADLVGGTPFLQGNAEFGKRFPDPKWQVVNPPKRAKEGDILISVRAPVGALNIADRSFGIGRGLAAVRAVKCDRRFLWWWFHTQVDLLDSESTGTTFKAIVAADLRNLEFPSIGLDEQRAIANYLDQETAQTEALVAKQEEFIGLLRERRDAVWAAGLERATEQRRLVPLRRVITSIVDGPFGSSLTSAHYADSGTRVIRLGNIGTNTFRAHDEAFIPNSYAEKLSGHDVRPGDVVIAGLGDETWPLGRAAVVPNIGPAIVKADCFRARPAADVSGRYLAWALSAPQTRSQVALMARGSTRKRINTSIARAIEIPVPSLERQNSILEASVTELSRVDTLIARAEEHIALAKERRAAVITAAVTGQFNVRTARKAG